jgi:protein MpaA
VPDLRSSGAAARAAKRAVRALGALVLLAAFAGSSGSLVTSAAVHRLQTQQGSTQRTPYLIGYSVDHRPIVAWLIAPRRAWRSMLVVGSVAGDEPGGIAVSKLLASEAAIAGVQLWLIPDVNPDGAARGTRVNAHGVDLNRNFPFTWRHLGKPGNRNYSGPGPSSEPETRAIEAFIQHTRPDLAVWLHQPYGLIDDSEGPGWAERQLGRALRLPLARLRDYPGSAIGYDNHLVPASAFDVELPGNLSQADTRRAAVAIRSLARRLATDPHVH